MKHLGSPYLLGVSHTCVIFSCIKDVTLIENKIDADLEQCLVDVDFWIECFMDQEREHEYYSVLFFKEREKPTEDRKIYSSQYYVALSPYSGEVWYFTDLKKEKEENHIYDE